MRTYAQYLDTMTVKPLNAIAKTLQLRGYSKLRKAALIEVIARQVGMDEVAAYAEVAPKILSVDNEADQPEIIKIMATVKPVAFSHTPAKAPESAPKPLNRPTPKPTTPNYASEATEDLIEAYRGMRATMNRARGMVHAKIAAKLRMISSVLRARQVNMRTV